MTKFASHHTDRLIGVVVKDIVIGAGRGGSRGDVGGAHPSPSIFKHVLDECSFSVILNLFDNNKSYALSSHNRKCTNKMHNASTTTKVSSALLRTANPG